MESDEEMAARIRIPNATFDERVVSIKAQLDALRQLQRDRGHSRRVQIIDNILVQMLGAIIDLNAQVKGYK
jgi:hypothetical protein